MKTLGEFRELTKNLPDNIAIEFHPITNAYLGASHPLRPREVLIFDDDGEHCKWDSPTATMNVYLFEEE